MAIYIGSTRYKAMVGSNRADFVTHKALPYDAEIEYLAATGTQYIDTGFYPRSTNTDIKVENKFNKSVLNGDHCVLGARTSTTASTGFKLPNFYNNKLEVQGLISSNSGTLSKTYSIDTDYIFVAEIKQGSQKFYVNGILEKETSNTGNCNSGSNLYLFAIYQSTVKWFFKGKIYYCKIWQDDVLVRDFIPVRKGTIGYMYDKVSGTLFGNAGTGDFVLGNDIVEIEYLESNGNQYINTEYYPNNATVITTKYYNQPKSQSPFAARWTGADTYDTFGVYVAEFNKTIVYFGRYSDTKYENISISSSNTIEMTIGVSEVVVNNSSISISRDSFTSSYPLYLFAMNNVGTVGFKSKTKMYNLKIVEGNTTILDLVPVRVGQVGYMRDKISGKLYGNSGTGSFTLGPDKT